MSPGFNSRTGGFLDNEEEPEEEIIDEQELMKIKSMKELKRQYRVAFNELKDLKNEANFTQQAIDTAKTQLVNDFELWYSDNFTSAMQQAESALGSFNDQNNLNTSTLSNKKSTSPLKVIITIV